MNVLEWTPVVDLIFKFLIIPGIGVLWRLSNTINELKLTLHSDFVTSKQLDKRLELERQITQGHN